MKIDKIETLKNAREVVTEILKLYINKQKIKNKKSYKYLILCSKYARVKFNPLGCIFEVSSTAI
jgi:hypothetical protein